MIVRHHPSWFCRLLQEGNHIRGATPCEGTTLWVFCFSFLGLFGGCASKGAQFFRRQIFINKYK